MIAPDSGRSAASVVLVTHDESSRARVGPVIEALLGDGEGPAEIVLVDNSDSEDGLRLARSYGVKLVSRHGGFSDGCNEGVLASTQSVIVLLGHDTLPALGFIPPLIRELDTPGVGAVIPTIEDGSRPGTFNTSGGHLTFLGLAWVSDLGTPIPDDGDAALADFPCGGAMAMRREVWDRFEGFRPDYFLYQEDSDLGWRLRLAGLRTVRVPESRVVHEYEFGRQPNKMFLLERNRLVTVLSNYQRRTLWLLAPVLIATEFAIALVALRDGWIGEKIRAWRSVWSNRSWISEGRVLAEKNREVGDAEMLRTMRSEISSMPEVRPPRGTQVVDRILDAYRRLLVRLLTVLERP